jgi:shikimate kinase/3-dehydroquinate synthase
VEAAKFGLLGDAQYFTWLERNRPALFARDAAALTHAIAVAVRGKAAIVARDERETGERMLLNLGHTFAHALEAWSGYSERLLHGEAVAIGICLAFRLSEELGLIGRASVARVEAHFAAFDLPTRIADVAGTERPEPETLLGLMGQDKKVRAGRLTLILVRAIGEAFVTRDVSAPIVRDFLSRQLALARS